MISKPCFLNSLNVSFEISGSVIGKKVSSASITVTLEPSLDHTLPSSRPIIPAPTIPNDLGTLLNASAPVLSTILSPNLPAGISMGNEPVAIIIFFPSNSSIEPSLLVTSTRLLPTTFPDPEIESTLLAANNPDMPPVSFETISSFLFIIADRSSFISLISIP